MKNTQGQKNLKQSETRTILRSSITLNPYNPKRHTDEQVKQQLKNFKKNGYLGGIVWNEQTGHLVDGHRRVQAMDLYYKYDGTSDYELKVEVVDFDQKTELEQLTYQALGNSKADYNLVAKYAPEIDPELAGISEEDYERIMELADTAPAVEEIADFSDAFLNPVTTLDKDMETNEEVAKRHEEKPKMTKEQVKAEKERCNGIATDRQGTQDLYIFLSAKTVEEKIVFCELLGIEPTNSMMVPLSDVLGLID